MPVLPAASSSTTTGTTRVTAQMHLFMRIHGKAHDRPILMGKNGHTDQQSALPIFKGGVDYCTFLHRALSASLPDVLTFDIADPLNPEPSYFNAANDFVISNPDFAGYQLQPTEVFTPQPSYWDGTRWVRPTLAFVAFAYPFKEASATSPLERLLKCKTAAMAPQSMFADFILALQNYV